MILKAYKVTQRSTGFCVVVFAQSDSKAKSLLVGRWDEFFEDAPSYSDFFEEVKDMIAKRNPKADGEYRGHDVMDWENSKDRLFLVKNLGYYCSDETDINCEGCVAMEFCSRKEEREETKKGE